MLTTLVGLPVSELDTPALLIDIDAMDRNIAHIARTTREAGVAWRPHAKGHKCPAIAHRQIAAGAIGVTCAKVSEAEVMAANGVRDILIANEVIGPIKTRRLAALIAATGADVIVAVDSHAGVCELNDAAARHGVQPRVVVEVDSGMKRCGVAPGEPALALAKAVDAAPHLRFAGVMAWEGHTVSMAEHDVAARGDRAWPSPGWSRPLKPAAPPVCRSISSPAAAAAPISTPRASPASPKCRPGAPRWATAGTASWNRRSSRR